MRQDTRRPHRIYIHIGWSTLGRLPLMPRDLRGAVELCLISLCRRLDAEPLAVRATADSVRMALRLKPSHAPATLVRQLKTGSQESLTDAGRGIHWGSGFASTTIGVDEVRHTIRLINRLD